MKARIRRDMIARAATAAAETTRQTYRYIVKNETLPPKVRYQAQLALTALPRNTSPSHMNNRCVETGRGRGVMRDFRMSRFTFRLKALAGELPGVEKSTW